MNRRKIVIRAALVLIGLPIVLVSIVFVSFYAVFYFPNRTNATTGTIVLGETVCSLLIPRKVLAFRLQRRYVSPYVESFVQI